MNRPITPADNDPSTTIVHLLRHGEVHNPDGILYGRLPGYHLSERGEAMARRIREVMATRDIVHMATSPLERAQETGAPLAAALGLTPADDERIIESRNDFQGMRFGHGRSPLWDPSTWPKLWNPLRPSWGEPYKAIAARMMSAVHDARDAALGHESVLVSHQLPIWITRLAIEQKSFVHDPRKRQCTICSITSLHFEGRRLVRLTYSEPAGDMIPQADKHSPFSSGGTEPSTGADAAGAEGTTDPDPGARS